MYKRFVFRHYWWLADCASALAIAIVFRSKVPAREGLIVTIVGAALGFCYFAQKQKLEELQLLKELFTEFNRRYDVMILP